MAQYKKNGLPRQVIKYQLSFKRGKDKGVYYITFPIKQKEKAYAKAKEFRKGFKGSTWVVSKIKRNVWVERDKK
jgi:hypothetical protein